MLLFVYYEVTVLSGTCVHRCDFISTTSIHFILYARKQQYDHDTMTTPLFSLPQ